MEAPVAVFYSGGGGDDQGTVSKNMYSDFYKDGFETFHVKFYLLRYPIYRYKSRALNLETFKEPRNRFQGIDPPSLWNRARICKRLRSLGIDSEAHRCCQPMQSGGPLRQIGLSYHRSGRLGIVSWGSLKGPRALAGRCKNPIFVLACQTTQAGGINSLESLPVLLKSLQIRAQRAACGYSTVGPIAVQHSHCKKS